MKAKHTCEALVKVYSGFHRSPHRVTAKYEYEGKWYCKAHHPPTVQAKSEERLRKWKAERDARNAVREEADAIREAEQRVLSAADAFKVVASMTYPYNKRCYRNLIDAVVVLRGLGWEPPVKFTGERKGD